jgi:hypothetical protein
MSDNSQSSKPSWRSICWTAERAEGVEQVTQSVIDAEAAIFVRWQELAAQSGDAQECADLRQAAKVLLKIKQDKLGWPTPGL